MSIEELREEVDEYQEDVEQVENDEVINDEQDTDDTDENEQEEAEPDDELAFSFDESDEDADPFAGQEAPKWVKEIRNENRELKRQQREWQQSQQQSQQQALRDKPTLDDHDYDGDAYEQDLQSWLMEKTQHDTQVQAESAKYKKYDDNYAASAGAMTAKVPNYKELEQNIVDVLPAQRQAMIKIACGDAARMVVALGNSPKRLAELAAMNEVEFVYALGKMENSMSNPQKSNKPKPTSHKLQGSAGGSDAQLEKLEAAADKSGDRSAVIAYRKKMRNK